jgi:carbon monoxide dehydrogenase subunit G
MELTNEFRVGVPISDAWKVLTDVERIAPFLPGAQLQEVHGDEYRGVVKVKVGPITAQYKGQATILEQDEAAGRVVLRASGRDTRGQGNATADITATMVADGDATKVKVVTDLTVTGKVAQFGRGVLAEVSAKLMGQFVDALEADLAASGSGAPPAAPTGSTAPAAATNGPTPSGASAPTTSNGDARAEVSGPRRIESAEAEPVDLLSVAGGSALKRLGPLAGLALVVAVVLIRRRARRAANQLNWLASNLASVGEVATRPGRARR